MDNDIAFQWLERFAQSANAGNLDTSMGFILACAPELTCGVLIVKQGPKRPMPY